MKFHLFQFVTKTKKLSCLCGWERTLKSTDMAQAHKRFEAHRAEASRA